MESSCHSTGQESSHFNGRRTGIGESRIVDDRVTRSSASTTSIDGRTRGWVECINHVGRVEDVGSGSDWVAVGIQCSSSERSYAITARAYANHDLAGVGKAVVGPNRQTVELNTITHLRIVLGALTHRCGCRARGFRRKRLNAAVADSYLCSTRALPVELYKVAAGCVSNGTGPVLTGMW